MTFGRDGTAKSRVQAFFSTDLFPFLSVESVETSAVFGASQTFGNGISAGKNGGPSTAGKQKRCSDCTNCGFQIGENTGIRTPGTRPVRYHHGRLGEREPQACNDRRE